MNGSGRVGSPSFDGVPLISPAYLSVYVPSICNEADRQTVSSATRTPTIAPIIMPRPIVAISSRTSSGERSLRQASSRRSGNSLAMVLAAVRIMTAR